MPRPSMVEINCKRDDSIRVLVKRLKEKRLKEAINGRSPSIIMDEIREEVGRRFNLAPSTIDLICRDKFYSLRWLKRQKEQRLNEEALKEK